jgi:two-component system nitrate/nitrite response regulator NarL
MKTIKQTRDTNPLDTSSATPSKTASWSSDEPNPAAWTATRAIRILLVDDHPVIIQGLISYLNRRGNLQVVGCATNGQEALRRVKELTPDVVLLDINMPEMGGFDTMAALQRENPETRVLVLTSYAHAEYSRRMRCSGARGYVLKNASPDDLLQAIEAVFAGGTFFNGDVSPLSSNGAHQPGSEANGTVSLNSRERELIAAVADGLRNKEIAARLGISSRSVETYRHRVLRKLDIHTTADLTKFAVRTGLCPVTTET